MEYCSNKTLSRVGLHIEGVYPDRCEVCQVYVDGIKVSKVNGRKEWTKEERAKRRIEFRRETIMANNWKLNEKV